MRRVYALVEGQTEEAFVKQLLVEHLMVRGIDLRPIVVETSRSPDGRKTRGGGTWPKWERNLHHLLRSQPDREVRFTTLFDLYGLPGGFPGLDLHGADADTVRRAERLEAALGRQFADPRLRPYLQIRPHVCERPFPRSTTTRCFTASWP